MPFYVWARVDALRRYAPGAAIAEADHVDAAREKLRAAFLAWLEEHRWWDKDDSSSWNMLIKQFEKDIALEPQTHETYLIQGSE